jgi:hypothetical protein
MASLDPDALRLEAVGNYFASIISPDTATLGSYKAIAETPILATYGGSTSDAKVFDGAITALASQKSGAHQFNLALSDLIAFAAATSISGPFLPNNPTDHVTLLAVPVGDRILRRILQQES